MDFKNTEVFNFEGALRGMRNPLNSWDRSDSEFDFNKKSLHEVAKSWAKSIENFEALGTTFEEYYMNRYEWLNNQQGNYIGPNDYNLMMRLIKAGSPHRKFLRQIFVSVDITAPLFWWKEFDTYKINTTANSTSTMHKLATTPITWDCFEHDDCTDDCLLLHVFDNEPYKMDDHISDIWDNLISVLETIRVRYLETKDKRYWKELIRLLPESWLQTRTVTMTYENLINIYWYRKAHKLNEWSGLDNSTTPNFIAWMKTLPYMKDIIETLENNG